MSQEKLKQALLKASRWEHTSTTDEKSKLTFNQARNVAVERIFNDFLNNVSIQFNDVNESNNLLSIEDIESLGFVFSHKYGDDKKHFFNNTYDSRDESIIFGELIDDKRQITITNNCGLTYFIGWIKTKKELKVLLQQVCISFHGSSKT